MPHTSSRHATLAVPGKRGAFRGTQRTTGYHWDVGGAHDRRKTTPMVVVPRQRHSTADDLGLLVEYVRGKSSLHYFADFSTISPARSLPPRTLAVRI